MPTGINAYFDTNNGVPTIYFSRLYTDLKLSGAVVGLKVRHTLSGLILAHLSGSCPIGIVLDRMEEYPEEWDGSRELQSEVVAWLRARYPLGV